MIIFAAFGAVNGVFSQQETTFSQYMFNRAAYNPASVGPSSCLQLNAQYRHQWTSFPGAPRTFGVNGHIGVPKLRSGFGAFVHTDVLGAFRNGGLGLAYAFRIPVAGGSLALGLQAAMQIYGVDPDRIRYADADDPLFLAGHKTAVLPDFGAGVFYHNRRAYAGFSVLRLAEFPMPVYYQALGTALRRHFFFTGGYDVFLNENVTLTPSTLVKFAAHAPFQFDLNANVMLYRMFWVGTGYRFRDAMIFNVGVFLLERSLRIGYSFDLTVARLGVRNTLGTHEVTVGYRLCPGRKSGRIYNLITPEYF